MPIYQIQREELVDVTRTYEVEADTEEEALSIVRSDGGELVDEQMQCTDSADNDSMKIVDIDGMDPEDWREMQRADAGGD